MTYRCIVADPPWPLSLAGKRKRPLRERIKPDSLPYPTMTIDEIKRLPIGDLAAPDCHLWLWTTNQHIEAGFKVLEAWGFKYLAPIHWIKPSGQGNWFIHRTQTILFGYKDRCVFERARYRQNIFWTGRTARHSKKPTESYVLIEEISCPPRLELFARKRRLGWDVWGNEVQSDIEIVGDAAAKDPPDAGMGTGPMSGSMSASARVSEPSAVELSAALRLATVHLGDHIERLRDLRERKWRWDGAAENALLWEIETFLRKQFGSGWRDQGQFGVGA
jgi:N6-adenosine-specific RNA methylase IME4